MPFACLRPWRTRSPHQGCRTLAISALRCADPTNIAAPTSACGCKCTHAHVAPRVGVSGVSARQAYASVLRSILILRARILSAVSQDKQVCTYIHGRVFRCIHAHTHVRRRACMVVMTRPIASRGHVRLQQTGANTLALARRVQQYSRSVTCRGHITNKCH